MAQPLFLWTSTSWVGVGGQGMLLSQNTGH